MNGYQKENGCKSLYMRILIDRKKKLIPLGIEWPEERFDAMSGLCLDRFKKDPDRADYNLIITDAIAKANEIFKYYRLTGQTLTITNFWKEYNTNLSKTDFLSFYSQRSKLRKKDKEITHSTWEDHMKTHRKLKRFASEIPFSDLDENWAFEFEAFLKKDIKSKSGDGTNVRWAHHKNVKTYLRLARKEKIKMIDPYEFFSAKQVPGSWKPIQEKDIVKLWAFYGDTTQQNNLRLAVRGFLFMVYTGIRVSDLRRAKPEWLNDGSIRFIPQKNKRFGREVQVPLSQKAKQLWQDALDENPTGYLFRSFAEQKFNYYMKRVMKKCEINSNIHNHAGRHTFITLFLKKGGSLDIASKYAGHRSVNTTMKYNHPDQERLQEQIKLMDDI